MKTAIIGLGYVGLPLSIQFSKSGLDVLGLDIDSKKAELLNQGESYIKHIGSQAIDEIVENGYFEASTDFSRVAECQAVIICVPTPLNKNREPCTQFSRGNCPELASWDLSNPRIDDLPGYHRYGIAQSPGKGFRFDRGYGLSSGLLTGTRRPGQSG